MSADQDLKLVGIGASPYTRKLRAAMRFRRLPFRFLVVGGKEASALPDPPLPMVPYLFAPQAAGDTPVAKSDTTPILNFLDETYPDRRLRPTDPALGLIDLILEDYGDEWLSKCMFHYRWSFAPDTRRAGSYLPYSRHIAMSPEQGAQAGAMFSQRQISRIGVVGSNAVTAPIIEASWRRYLEIFDAHIQETPFFLGQRPGSGDFACYGQMTMLVITDPTPSAVAFDVSPRAYAWTERCEDLSGLDVSDKDWIDLDHAPDSLHTLLCEIGRTYVPFMIANARAVAQGLAKVETEIDGRPWVQDAFVYQAKCLKWLRDAYQALSGSDRARLDQALKGTGCGLLFSAA